MMIPLIDALIALLVVLGIAIAVLIWREDKLREVHQEELYKLCETLFPNRKVFEEAYLTGQLGGSRVLRLIQADPWLSEAIASHTKYLLELSMENVGRIASVPITMKFVASEIQEQIRRKQEEAKCEQRLVFDEITTFNKLDIDKFDALLEARRGGKLPNRSWLGEEADDE